MLVSGSVCNVHLGYEVVTWDPRWAAQCMLYTNLKTKPSIALVVAHLDNKLPARGSVEVT